MNPYEKSRDRLVQALAKKDPKELEGALGDFEEMAKKDETQDYEKELLDLAKNQLTEL